jgi:hypothetical protein
MRAHEWGSDGPYPLLAREWLNSSDRFDDPAGRELADRIITAYAAEHLPIPNAEQIAAAVDWKVTIRGLTLAKERGISLERMLRDRKLLAQARCEVAAEAGKSHEAVKQDHTRVRRDHRVKHRP